jgi:hypothetical protein
MNIILYRMTIAAKTHVHFAQCTFSRGCTQKIIAFFGNLTQIVKERTEENPGFKCRFETDTNIHQPRKSQLSSKIETGHIKNDRNCLLKLWFVEEIEKE